VRVCCRNAERCSYASPATPAKIRNSHRGAQVMREGCKVKASRRHPRAAGVGPLGGPVAPRGASRRPFSGLGPRDPRSCIGSLCCALFRHPPLDCVDHFRNTFGLGLSVWWCPETYIMGASCAKIRNSHRGAQVMREGCKVKASRRHPGAAGIGPLGGPVGPRGASRRPFSGLGPRDPRSCIGSLCCAFFRHPPLDCVDHFRNTFWSGSEHLVVPGNLHHGCLVC
jgi:hypothetical protein